MNHMLQNVKNGEINPRLIYTSTRLTAIKYSRHRTLLVATEYCNNYIQHIEMEILKYG